MTQSIATVATGYILFRLLAKPADYAVDQILSWLKPQAPTLSLEVESSLLGRADLFPSPAQNNSMCPLQDASQTNTLVHTSVKAGLLFLLVVVAFLVNRRHEPRIQIEQSVEMDDREPAIEITDADLLQKIRGNIELQKELAQIAKQGMDKETKAVFLPEQNLRIPIAAFTQVMKKYEEK